MIRQYMTTAAILAAGTMLAGAAVDGWTDATYTLVGNNNPGTNGLTAGRGADVGHGYRHLLAGRRGYGSGLFHRPYGRLVHARHVYER